MSRHKIAYVVPTMDRAEDLEKLLASIEQQTVMPDQIVIVDASQPDIRYVCEAHPNLPLVYERIYPPSLTTQRNAGMARLNDDITLAGYLDDDIVLEPDATEKMLSFWRSAQANIGGASFSIINQPPQATSKLYSFFLMNASRPGQVLSSGFPVQIPFVEDTIETEWLYGGATIWRRSVIDDFDYDEWYIGHGFLEDLDYSYRVSRDHKLYVVGDARLWHFSRPIAEGKHFALGRQQVFNRLYFVRKIGTFPKLAVAWGLLGQILLNAYGGLIRRDSNAVNRLKGNLVALGAAIKGRDQSFEGNWK